MTYLSWLTSQTPTRWWHDSADSGELDIGIERGAIGATTNPVLSTAALKSSRALWAEGIDQVVRRRLPGEQQAEALMRIPVSKAAAKLRGKPGFVCAQLNP